MDAPNSDLPVYPADRIQFSLRWILILTTAIAMVLSFCKSLGEQPIYRLADWSAPIVGQAPALGQLLLPPLALVALFSVPLGILMIGVRLATDRRTPRFLLLWLIGAIGLVADALIGANSPTQGQSLLAHCFMFMAFGSMLAAIECAIRRPPPAVWLLTALAAAGTLSFWAVMVIAVAME